MVQKGALPRPPRHAFALGGGVPPCLGGRRYPRRQLVGRRSPVGEEGAGDGGLQARRVREAAGACGGERDEGEREKEGVQRRARAAAGV
jgi:hypothetical protein